MVSHYTRSALALRGGDATLCPPRHYPNTVRQDE